MNMFRAGVLLWALAVCVGAPAEAVPRAPTGKWVVDFADAQCFASRDYGEAGKPVLLALKAPPLGNVIQVAVIHTGSGGGEAAQYDAEFAFDEQKPFKTTMLKFTPKGRKQTAYLINLPEEAWQPLKAAKSISFRSGKQLHEEFAIRQMPSISKLLDECVTDLRKVWGISQIETNGEMPRGHGPQGTLQGLVKSNDYPAVAIDQLQGGSAAFALLIDENGKVVDCTITATSGVASLDAQSCSIIKERAKFKPAIGREGKPTKGSFSQRITWRIQ